MKNNDNNSKNVTINNDTSFLDTPYISETEKRRRTEELLAKNPYNARGILNNRAIEILGIKNRMYAICIVDLDCDYDTAVRAAGEVVDRLLEETKTKDFGVDLSTLAELNLQNYIYHVGIFAK